MLNRYNEIIFTAVLVLLHIIFAADYSAAQQQNPHDMDNLGKDLFIENRCVRCHTIGRGRFVGPDLKNVGDRYSREELIQWIENPQAVYQTLGKMPVNEGYPPMPPMEVHPMAAQAIADYLLTVDIKPDTAKGGTIIGKVVNETSKEAVSGVKITLTSFLGDKDTGKTEIESGPDGGYKFTDLPWDRSYAVTINYDDAEYSSDKMVFKPGEDTMTVDLPVYEPTTSPEGISITESHFIIQATEEGFSVADLTVFDIAGDRMYVGSTEIGDGKRETLRFSVPEDASNVNFIHGLDPASVVRTKEGFSDTASVLPGPKRVVFAYGLPRDSKETVIEKTIEYPTATLLLLVSETSDEVKVDGLQGGDTVQIENENFLRWTGTNLKPGDTIKVTITGEIVYSDYVKWGAVGILALLVIAGIIYSSTRGGGGEPAKRKPESRETLMDRRSTLIKEIAALDDSFESGHIDEKRYREIRGSKKDELVELTRRLRM